MTRLVSLAAAFCAGLVAGAVFLWVAAERLTGARP